MDLTGRTDAVRRCAVIDAHVHVFPPHLVAERSPYLERDRWFELLYTNPNALLATTETLIAAMDEAGVAQSVLCGFPWSDPGLCHEHNEYMADAARRFPDRLTWLGIAIPNSPRGAAEAAWCFDQGAVGIGELNADAQRFDWLEPMALRSFVDVCVSADRPVLLHASEAVGHHYPGKGTATPDKLLTFLEAFRELRVIAAHWGGGLPFFELMPEVAAATGNVVYDCAASTYLYRPQIFRTVLDLVGPERVLYGSDYPVLRMDRFLKRVLEVEWRDDDELDAILAGNAHKIFGLGKAQT
jgi:predicted TIM-barrel fold metal-dependent hydrolase